MKLQAQPTEQPGLAPTRKVAVPPAERGLALIEVAVVLLVIGFLWLALGAPGT